MPRCMRASALALAFVALPALASAATFTVTKTADTADGACDADCSLREAVNAAAANPGADTVSVPAGTYVLTIPGLDNAGLVGDLDLTGDIEIVGAGADVTTIDAGGIDRVISSGTSPGAYELTDLTITGGIAPTTYGGAINVSNGGGSTLTLTRCHLTGNEAGRGSAIYTVVETTIVDSTISGNTATEYSTLFANGYGSWHLTNSTVADNSGNTSGGIRTVLGDASFTHSTILADSGGPSYISIGGSTATFTGSIVEGSCSGSAARVSNGGNIESPGDTCAFTDPSDQVSVSDLGLDSLASNGGGTPTLALLSESPAIDSALNASCPSSDQRGQPRPQDGDDDQVADCDSGAYELRLASTGPGSLFSYDSDPGDWVGKGETDSFTQADGAFKWVVNQPELNIQMDFNDGGFPSERWSVALDAPDGDPLTVGTYLGATRWPFNGPGEPGLSVSGNGAACNTVTGEFTVYEISYNGEGELTRIWADFEQHCEGAPEALYGTVDFRAVPTTYTVTKTADTNDRVCDADCSLREAIVSANDNSPALDTIVVPAGTYTLSIAGGELYYDSDGALGDLELSDDVVLSGAGAGVTVFDAAGIDRIFDVNDGAVVTLSDFTATGGYGDGVDRDGGAISVDEDSDATIRNAELTGNESTGPGGAISSEGALTLVDSVVYANVAATAGGGLEVGDFYGNSTTTVINSTISGNIAGSDGGGILGGRGSLALQNVTLSGNQAPNVSALYYDSDFGTPGTISNTIFDGDCDIDGTMRPVSTGGNIESPGNTCDLLDPSDQVNVADLMLDALADNGGPTSTIALLPGSPAIDAGILGSCPAADQRGLARPEDGDGDQVADCDAGAYEAPELVIAPLPTPADAFCSGATAAGDKVVVDRGTLDGDARSTGAIQTKRGGVITGAQFPNDPSVDYANLSVPGGIPNLGNLVLTGSSTFELPAGESVVTKLNLSDTSSVTVAGTANDPSILYIDSTVAAKVREDAQLNAGGDPAALILIEVNGENVQFQNDSISAVAVFAPDSTVTVNRAAVTGAVVGNRVNVKNSSGLITESLVRCP